MRDKRLDILRCIAVLLVIQVHSGVSNRLSSAGRVGVDLFFVLSGFLISGLLFTEFKKRGSIDFGRFFIRRSLKIYPAYYFLLLASLAYRFYFHLSIPLSRFVGEVLYLQNYSSMIWGHEWSLAVEEHFYILLPIFLLILIRRSPRSADPFRSVPLTFLMVAIACLALRLITALSFSSAELQQWKDLHWAYATTHCRLDGIFFGVLLGYFFHFRAEVFDRLLHGRRNLVLLVMLSVILLSPCLLLPQANRFMLTIGLTSLYIGFGIVLMLCLRVRGILPSAIARPCESIGKGFAYVGLYSYSIYLWHFPVLVWGIHSVEKFLKVSLGPASSYLFYVSVSIGFGIFMSRILEYPILRLRDRFFPSLSGQSIRLPLSEERILKPGSGPNACAAS